MGPLREEPREETKSLNDLGLNREMHVGSGGQFLVCK